MNETRLSRRGFQLNLQVLCLSNHSRPGHKKPLKIDESMQLIDLLGFSRYGGERLRFEMDQASVLDYRRMRLKSNCLSGAFACFIPFASAKSAKGNVAVDVKKELKETVKREKISRIFEGEKKAKDRKGNAAATLDYLRLRVEAEALPKTSVTTKIKQKLHIGPKKDTKTSKVDEAQKKYIEGVLGRDPRLKEEKSGWRKAASVEGLHTVTGRVLSLVGGTGGMQMHTSLGKTLFHQVPGYAVQAPIAGWGRIASEIWQVQLNDGGKPKLPPYCTECTWLEGGAQGVQGRKGTASDAQCRIAQCYCYRIGEQCFG